jgi:hypothetical protein
MKISNNYYYVFNKYSLHVLGVPMYNISGVIGELHLRLQI